MRRKQMLALSILFFVLAGVFLTLYAFENQKPIDDSPIYPATPDNTGPEIFFVPSVERIRALLNQEIVITIIVVDWQGEIDFYALYRNSTLLTEGNDYILHVPGTTDYPRKIFTGCRDEFRITYRITALAETTSYEIRIVTEDSAGNPSAMVYSFKVEVVQNAPEFQVLNPDAFVADQLVIPVEVELTANQTMVKSMDVYISGQDMGPLLPVGGDLWRLDVNAIMVPTGLHTMDIAIRLRSGLMISIYICVVIHNPSLVPSMAPAIGILFCILGVVVFLIRREMAPEDEKHLAGINGKLYFVEGEGAKKDEKHRRRKKKKKKSLW